MKPKRYLTLFLSALMLVCVLAGCAPNVEHRFDTTEYSAQDAEYLPRACPYGQPAGRP